MKSGQRQIMEAISMASNLSFIMAVNAAVGLLLGKGIDKLLDSSPWGVAIGVALGMIAGLRAVCKKAAGLDGGNGKKKMTAILKRTGEIRILFLCLALWVALFSLVLIISGKVSYLPGFLLGAAGSVLYAYSLYFHRVPALLKMPSTFETAQQRKDGEGRPRPHSLNYLRTSWMKTLQQIAAVILVILAVSHFSQSSSFLAALFGFFSFQISLFIYAVLIAID